MYGYNFSGSQDDNAYTDLALERRRADTHVDGIEYKREIAIGGVWERINVTTQKGAESIGRPIGIYDTLNLGRIDILDSDGIDDAKCEIEKELCYIFDESEAYPERILVVGLGNPSLTPDSLGYDTARLVKPTMHIKDFDEGYFKKLACSEIAVCTPGVFSMSGLDALVTVKGICDVIAPTAVIAIDAIASRAVERLGTTVQISNTGIIPGSGLGGVGQAIDRSALGIPVIAIGIPTVINSRHFSHKESKRDDYPSMFVSPKEINEIVEVGAEIISGGINRAFGLYI